METENNLREEVWQEISKVEDPEIGISIVELGLVYGLEIEEGTANVQMTLTSMGCPMGPQIQAAVHAAATRIPGIQNANVEIVWQPKWDPREMASEDARMQLGIF